MAEPEEQTTAEMIRGRLEARFEEKFPNLPEDAVIDFEHEELVWDFIDELLQEHGVLHGVPIAKEVNGHALIGSRTDDQLSQFLEPRTFSTREHYENICAREGGTYRNHWKRHKDGFSTGTVVLYNDNETGKLKKLVFCEHRQAHARLELLIETCSARVQASHVTAERRAREKLFTHIDRSQQKSYELNDCFLEKSSSGIMYILRKGKPTIAMRERPGAFVPICTLCLHPMGYYDGTWAGALVPSDEVIAHLLFIRADEKGFWREANHHQLDSPLSGI